MSKPASIFLSVFLLAIPALVTAAERIITDSGREVELLDDGSWQFASEDIFATNSEGQRIRLRPDGSWEVLEEYSENTQHTAIYQAPMVYEPLQFNLDRAVIQNVRGEAPGLSKNTRLVSHSVFYLQVAVPANETEAIALSFSGDEFALVDSAERRYDLLSVEPANLDLQPGEVQLVEVRFYDSPAWKFGKSYDLSISSDLLASDRDLVFSLPLSEIRSVELDSF